MAEAEVGGFGSDDDFLTILIALLIDTDIKDNVGSRW
jgi:hypothetical protein